MARPAAFYGHYLRSPKFDEVALTVEALMQGRRTESFEVRMTQGDKLILVAMVRTAMGGEGLEHDVARAPEVPDPEDLPRVEDLRRPEHGQWRPFWRNLNVRVGSRRALRSRGRPFRRSSWSGTAFAPKPQRRTPSWTRHGAWCSSTR